MKKILLATAALLLPAAAQAQSWTPMGWLPPGATGLNTITGPYTALGFGWNHAEQRDVEAQGGNATYFDLTRASRQGRLRFEEGFVGLGSIGWGFGNGFRVEAEGSYRENSVAKLGGFPGRNGGNAGVAFRDIDGVQRQYGVMGNVLYDLDLTNFGLSPLLGVPYIGGGAGYMWSDMDKVRGTRLPANANSVRIDGNGGAFAYQAIGGIAMPLTWVGVPGLSLTAEYRYMGTLEQDVDGRVVNPAGNVVTTGGVPARGDFRLENAGNHSVLVGLRYAFNTPVPPAPVVAPAPAAAPAPARTYLVFFDFDRADLTDRARQIIGEASQNSRRVQSTRIEVAGHADRSGTPAYNQRLSQRRAEVVAAELVRGGVNRSDISVQAFGESRPLVPTADGVREPQNRRVEIVLR